MSESTVNVASEDVLLSPNQGGDANLCVCPAAQQPSFCSSGGTRVCCCLLLTELFRHAALRHCIIMQGKRGIYGKKGTMQTHLSLAFAESQVTYSGAKNGDVYKWQGNQLLLVVVGAHKGAINSIHAYFVNSSKQVPTGYVTGSKDGTLRIWDPNFEELGRSSTGPST